VFSIKDFPTLKLNLTEVERIFSLEDCNIDLKKFLLSLIQVSDNEELRISVAEIIVKNAKNKGSLQDAVNDKLKLTQNTIKKLMDDFKGSKDSSGIYFLEKCAASLLEHEISRESVVVYFMQCAKRESQRLYSGRDLDCLLGEWLPGIFTMNNSSFIETAKNLFKRPDGRANIFTSTKQVSDEWNLKTFYDSYLSKDAASNWIKMERYAGGGAYERRTGILKQMSEHTKSGNDDDLRKLAEELTRDVFCLNDDDTSINKVLAPVHFLLRDIREGLPEAKIKLLEEKEQQLKLLLIKYSDSSLLGVCKYNYPDPFVINGLLGTGSSSLLLENIHMPKAVLSDPDLIAPESEKLVSDLYEIFLQIDEEKAVQIKKNPNFKQKIAKSDG